MVHHPTGPSVETWCALLDYSHIKILKSVKLWGSKQNFEVYNDF